MIPNTIEKTPAGGLPAANCSLFLGDCLEMMRHIPDGSVDMVMCDLPYGTTQNKWDSVIPLEPLWCEYRRVCKPRAAIVLTACQPFTSMLVMSNLKEFKYCWYWRKNRATNVLNAKKMPLRNTEELVVFGGNRYNPQGLVYAPEPSRNSKRDSDCYGAGTTKSYVREYTNYPKQSLDFNSHQRVVHPTQKPVELMEYMIRTYTNEGQTVLDNTMGSGTTGVACMNTGRRFIGIERDEEYFRVASERISSANAGSDAPGANG